MPPKFFISRLHHLYVEKGWARDKPFSTKSKCHSTTRLIVIGGSSLVFLLHLAMLPHFDDVLKLCNQSVRSALFHFKFYCSYERVEFLSQVCGEIKEKLNTPSTLRFSPFACIVTCALRWSNRANDLTQPFQSRLYTRSTSSYRTRGHVWSCAPVLGTNELNWSSGIWSR